MRGNMVVNRRMMSNVISDQYDVVSNRNERPGDGVVFQDEVLSNTVCEDGRF